MNDLDWLILRLASDCQGERSTILYRCICFARHNINRHDYEIQPSDKPTAVILVFRARRPDCQDFGIYGLGGAALPTNNSDMKQHDPLGSASLTRLYYSSLHLADLSSRHRKH